MMTVHRVAAMAPGVVQPLVPTAPALGSMVLRLRVRGHGPGKCLHPGCWDCGADWVLPRQVMGSDFGLTPAKGRGRSKGRGRERGLVEMQA